MEGKSPNFGGKKRKSTTNNISPSGIMEPTIFLVSFRVGMENSGKGTSALPCFNVWKTGPGIFGRSLYACLVLNRKPFLDSAKT